MELTINERAHIAEQALFRYRQFMVDSRVCPAYYGMNLYMNEYKGLVSALEHRTLPSDPDVRAECISRIIDMLRTRLHRSLIQSGCTVGPIAGHALGERTTQSTLDKFHKTGTMNMFLSQGVSRFQELLSSSHKPKFPTCTIYFERAYPLNDSSVLRRIYTDLGLMVHVRIQQVSQSIVAVDNAVVPDWWMEGVGAYSGYRMVCRRDMLYKYRIHPEQLAVVVADAYPHLECRSSHPHEGIVDMIHRDPSTPLPLAHELLRLTVGGIPGITDVIVAKHTACRVDALPSMRVHELYDRPVMPAHGGTEVWMGQVHGSCTLRRILHVPGICRVQSISNNIWDILDTFGIEAVRAYLIEEFMNIMDGVNACHVMLLVERMTFTGSIDSISRYTTRQDVTGVLSRASFEETMEHLIRAAVNAEVDVVNSITSNVICGRMFNAGTGMVDVVYRHNNNE